MYTVRNSFCNSFSEKSPLFKSIQQVSMSFTGSGNWPSLSQYSREFQKLNIRSHGNKRIHAVTQAGKPASFEDYYESRIFLQGELQTRLENWHDFFNALCWLQFPKIKATLNALHFEYSQQRDSGSNRCPLENAIALFDECGAIIVANDDALLDLVRNHRWETLFVDHGDDFGRHIQCYVFGHALFEKALMPYVGMTAHTKLLLQDNAFFHQDYYLQLDEVDRLVSDAWTSMKIASPEDLQPFPLLGVPGWYENQDKTFYANKAYFRKKRD